MAYYAVYSKDRQIVVCRPNSKTMTERKMSSTKSYRQQVGNIQDGLEIRVLQSIKGQESYLKDVSTRDPFGYEIVETDKKGNLI
jgi:hypothetical protein